MFNSPELNLSQESEGLDRMDQTILWLDWLEPDELKLVWGRAERLPWKRISWMFGISRTTAWQRWMATLMVVSARADTPSSRSKNLVVNHDLQSRS